jgi:hypothetical protein
MKVKAVFSVLTVCMLTLQAQTVKPGFKTYDWDSIPKTHLLLENEKKEGTVILKDIRMTEFQYDMNGDLGMYQTRHNLIKLNNDKSIEENNRVYIPLQGVTDFISLKARSISKDGKVTLVNKKDIKDVDNLENLGPFRIFAFEGVEIGSEIEYIYTVKREASLFGTEVLQGDEPKREVVFTLISPQNLEFETKSYNDLADAAATSLDDGRRMLKLSVDNLQGVKEERYAPYRGSLKRIEFKLGYNYFKGKDKVLTWNEAGDRYFSILTSTTKSEQKAVRSFIKEMKINKKASLENRIRYIESYVKRNLVTKEGGGMGELDEILKNKTGSPMGMAKLFMEIFMQAGIKYELVLTTDRFNARFDGSFETWNYLDNLLLYLPDAGDYIAPGQMFSRYGIVPNEWICNDGLFIEPLKIGKKLVGISKVKNIKCNDYKGSYDNLYADITINVDLVETNVHLKRTMSGYSTGGLQAVFHYLPDDSKKETTDQLLKIMGEDSKLTNIKLENDSESDSGIRPLIIECDLKTSSLLEKAGDKILFKIGDVIGPQAELYQEDKRKLDVENEYNRGYHREITFVIPDGYKVSNPDMVKMNVSCIYNGETAAEFVSSYKMDGNKMIVIIEENYRLIRLPVEKFETFRKVINAAADFNKVTLILEKK